MNTIYPVGSLYFGTQSTCPLQSAGIGTWTRIATNFVTGSTAPVIGNGMAIGLNNGTFLTGLYQGPDGVLGNGNGKYGTSVGDTVGSSAGSGQVGASVGLTTAPDKSGIITDLPMYTVNVWRRTA